MITEQEILELAHKEAKLEYEVNKQSILSLETELIENIKNEI